MTDTPPRKPCSPSPEYAAELRRILAARMAAEPFQRSLGQWRSWFAEALQKPSLRMVIWMATRRCNLRCRYCVLPHEESPGDDLSTEEVKRVFSQIAEDFDPSNIMIGITGGEATLRPDLVEIVRHMVGLGFRTVAVDSNGVNYGRDPSLMDRLVEAGMRCPTISVDGVGEAQRVLRGDASAGALPWKAIEYLQERYPDLGTTTICAASPGNLTEVPLVFQRFEDLGIRFARVSAIFPLGRAAEADDEVLAPEDLVQVLAWTAEQRSLFAAGKRSLEIEFVDDGWCGVAWEGGLLRGSFLYCRAGITVLGIEHDGRIVGCPVIHADFNNRGHVRADRVLDVWMNNFQPFRDRSWLKKGDCASCNEWPVCQGGSLHNHNDAGHPTRCTALLLKQGLSSKLGGFTPEQSERETS